MSDPRRDFLRHAVATLSYRGAKAVRDVTETFPSFRCGPGTRTPAEILAHVCDLLDWAVSMVEGHVTWRDSAPGAWDLDVQRFFDGLARLDQSLASGAPLGVDEEKIFQGPVADALTHIGQIALLRRLAGAPVRAENYFKADIVAGRVGPVQSVPRREFD